MIPMIMVNTLVMMEMLIIFNLEMMVAHGMDVLLMQHIYVQDQIIIQEISAKKLAVMVFIMVMDGGII